MSGTKQKSIRAEREKKKSVWKNWQLYIMCLPAVIYFLIFAYKPMYGIIIAFKNYSMRKGIMGSPWIGFGNFERLFLLVSYHFKEYADAERADADSGISHPDPSGADTQ